jgi:DNA polymerase III sliding clamp (beta) subunit (PCNA family)
MKFTCNAKDIASAVTTASKVVNAHTTVPILNNVLVAAKSGRVSVRATDLEPVCSRGIWQIYRRRSCRCKVQQAERR